MAFDVLDFDNFLRSYVVNKLKALRPELDVSENSVVDDIYIKPLIAVVSPLIEAANTVDLMRDLDNYIYMTDDQIDQIGTRNYFLSRNMGEAAKIIIKLSFVKVLNTENLIIPAGTIFETSGNLKFQTESRLEFTPSEMLAKYNPSTLTYDVSIEVIALEAGSAYNINSGQALTPLVKFSNYLLDVTCMSISSKGYDNETNVDYVGRIKTFYTSQFLGSKTGYRSEIMSVFSEVDDLFVAGYGDPEMTRDVFDVIVGGIPSTVHIGGKVDMYIKGSTYQNSVSNIVMHSPRLQLAASESVYPTTVELNLSITKTVYDSTTPVTTYTTGINPSGYWYVVIDASEFDPSIISTFNVAYGETNSETFDVGLTEVSLTSPFKNVVSIVSSDESQTVLPASSYQITRYDLSGNIIDESSIYYMTTQETAKLKVVDMTGIDNGSVYVATYNVNKTLNNLVNYFDIDENRIITADLLIKEATAVPVNVWARIKSSSGIALDENQISEITGAISAFFGTLQLGNDVQESDLVGFLYGHTTVAPYIDYVELPLKTFSVPADPEAAVIADASHSTSLSIDRKSYASINKIVIDSIV